MIKLIVMLKRKPGITREEFSSHWRDTHAPLVLSVHEVSSQMRRYIQNHIIPAKDSTADLQDGFDGIFECWYDSYEALKRVTQSQKYWDVVYRDELNFIDHGRCISYIIEENVVIEGP